MTLVIKAIIAISGPVFLVGVLVGMLIAQKAGVWL